MDEWSADNLKAWHTENELCSTYTQLNLQIIIIIIIIKKIGNARPGEGDCHPISPKTPAPHYQPIEEKKRKGK